MKTYSHDIHVTHRRLGWGPSKCCILLEDIVGPWTKENEDIDNATLRYPLCVSLRYILIRLEIRQQLSQDVLEGVKMNREREEGNSFAEPTTQVTSVQLQDNLVTSHTYLIGCSIGNINPCLCCVVPEDTNSLTPTEDIITKHMANIV